MGYASIGGMGDKMQLTFLEIDSYMRITRTSLTSWEVLVLRTLSLEYVIQSQKKEAQDFPPFMNGLDEFSYLMSLKK